MGKKNQENLENLGWFEDYTPPENSGQSDQVDKPTPEVNERNALSGLRDDLHTGVGDLLERVENVESNITRLLSHEEQRTAKRKRRAEYRRRKRLFTRTRPDKKFGEGKTAEADPAEKDGTEQPAEPENLRRLPFLRRT
jgi:hypothetical protein